MPKDNPSGFLVRPRGLEPPPGLHRARRSTLSSVWPQFPYGPFAGIPLANADQLDAYGKTFVITTVITQAVQLVCEKRCQPTGSGSPVVRGLPERAPRFVGPVTNA